MVCTYVYRGSVCLCVSLAVHACAMCDYVVALCVCMYTCVCVCMYVQNMYIMYVHINFV